MKHTKKLARGYVNRFSRAAKLIDTMAKHVRHMNNVDFAELNEHFITVERRRNYGPNMQAALKKRQQGFDVTLETKDTGGLW